jgi:uncharacterized protein YdhG (YjbR/CyaY superfamily)
MKTVDEYLASLPMQARDVVQRVRRAIRKALPQATETISYGMPTYKIENKAVLRLAAWRSHFALYAATASVVRTFATELKPYEVDNRCECLTQHCAA